MKDFLYITLLCLILISLFAGPFVTLYSENLIYMVIMLFAIPLYCCLVVLNGITDILEQQQKEQDEKKEQGRS